MKTVWCRAKSLMRLRAIVFISFFFAAVVGPGGSFAGTKAFFTYSTPKYDRVKMYDIASDTVSQIFYDSLSDWSVGNLAVTPEPSTLGMLALGGLAMLKRRGRRR